MLRSITVNMTGQVVIEELPSAKSLEQSSVAIDQSSPATVAGSNRLEPDDSLPSETRVATSEALRILVSAMVCSALLSIQFYSFSIYYVTLTEYFDVSKFVCGAIGSTFLFLFYAVGSSFFVLLM